MRYGVKYTPKDGENEYLQESTIYIMAEKVYAINANHVCQREHLSSSYWHYQMLSYR